MLTVQSSKTAFASKQRNYTPEEIQAIEEREYRKNYGELEDQRDEFIDLANNKEINAPKVLKTALEGGAVVTTALLGGMATGWGAKKTLQGVSKLNKSTPMKNFKRYVSAAKEFIIKSAKAIKEEFKKSDVYKMPSNFFKKYSEKFKKTSFGKPIAKFFENVKDGIKTITKQIKNGIKYIYKKITGIDKAKAEKFAVNTVGVAGGAASGITAIKEKQERKAELADNESLL